MRRAGGPSLAAFVAVAVAVAAAAIGTGCEQIVQWEDDAGDGGDDGGQDAGMDGSTAAYLASFGPGGQYIRSPADGGTTYPNTLMVVILRDGENGPVQINIGSSDASVASVAGGSVVIPVGSTFAAVPVTSQAGGTATLTATFDGGLLQATLTSLPRLLISEVAAANLAVTDDELVELYNPTAVDFSLAGYVIQYHSSSGSQYLNVCTIPAGKRIAPFSFFLIGVNAYNRAEDTHDTWNNAASFAAANGTVRLGMPGIGLMNGDALTLDRVAWGSSAMDPEGAPVSVTGLTWGSIERKARATSTSATMTGADEDAGNAHDTDNNAIDWVTQITQSPQTSLAPAEPPP